jgi:hypothetical protein
VFYNIDVKIELVSEEQDGDVTDIVFQLFFKNDQYEKFHNKSSVSLSSLKRAKRLDLNQTLNMDIFFELFPFHVVS